ncbi:unnamed protein product [Arctogadus glacialis]
MLCGGTSAPSQVRPHIMLVFRPAPISAASQTRPPSPLPLRPDPHKVRAERALTRSKRLRTIHGKAMPVIAGFNIGVEARFTYPLRVELHNVRGVTEHV